MLPPLLVAVVFASEPTPPDAAADAEPAPAAPAAAPGVTPAPEVAPPGPPTVAPVARYDTLRLVRTPGPDWQVVDGRGREVDVQRWAYLTGDDGPWREAARRSAWAGWGQRAVGVGLLALAAVPASAIGRPPSGGPGRDAWSKGTTEDDVLLGAAAILGGGGVALVAISFADTPAHNVFPPLRRFRSPGEVDAHLEAYNAALAAEFPPAP